MEIVTAFHCQSEEYADNSEVEVRTPYNTEEGENAGCVEKQYQEE